MRLLGVIHHVQHVMSRREWLVDHEGVVAQVKRRVGRGCGAAGLRRYHLEPTHHALHDVRRGLAGRRHETNHHVVAGIERERRLRAAAGKGGIRTANVRRPRWRRSGLLHRCGKVRHRLALVEPDDRKMMKLLPVVHQTECIDARPDRLWRSEAEVPGANGDHWGGHRYRHARWRSANEGSG